MSFEQLEEAKECLRLQIIKYRSSNCFLNAKYRAEELAIDTTVQESFHYTSSLAITQIENPDGQAAVLNIYEYHTGIRLMPKEYDESDAPEPILEIRAVFDVEYISETELAAEPLREFAKSNVGYHVWPYWREFVQSTTTRLNVDPIATSVGFYNPRLSPDIQISSELSNSAEAD
jgi:hypothetical protein